MMNEDTIVVFTRETLLELLSQGGSKSWKVDPLRASRCRYIVCTKNTSDELFPEYGITHEHRAAFLVGRISGVFESSGSPGRQIIKFDEFAKLDGPIIGEKTRIPTTYTTLAQLGIDPKSLAFERVKDGLNDELRKHDDQPLTVENEPRPAPAKLSIRDAKPQLAAYYDVPLESVEILIRG